MYEAHSESDPRELLELMRAVLPHEELVLQRAEARLLAGVYALGPRKGQPFDAHDRTIQEARTQELRASVVEHRACAARAALELGPDAEAVP